MQNRRPLSVPLELLLVTLCFVAVRTGLRAVGFGFSGSAAVVASLAVIAYLQRLRGTNLRALGLSRPASLKRAIPFTMLAILLTVVIGVGVLPWLWSIFGAPEFVETTTALWIRLARVILIAWFGAALGEELLFRGFLQGRLLEIFPSAPGGTLMAIGVQAAIFGALHYTQGWAGGITAGLIGAVYGLIVVAAGRNLWPVVIAHALPDTISLLQG